MNIKDVKKIIKTDKQNYLGDKKIFYKMINHQNYIYFQALKYNRLYRFYKLNSKNIIAKIKLMYYRKLKNKYCNFFNLELNGANIGSNFIIYHSNIVINEQSKIGNNCKFHGNNCVGNNGINNECPIIGKNVDVGFGVTIIGNVKINDNITIGANSVVTKNLTENGGIYVGNPARLIRRKNEKDF